MGQLGNFVLYEIGGQDNTVCKITLNRPDKHNAINKELANELLEAFTRVRDEDQVKVVLFSGAGKSFSAGGDLSVLAGFNHKTIMDWLARTGYEILKAMKENEKVVVGKIKGNCLAGGLELALACDLLYASEKTKFGVTEINMGILPGWGGTVHLARSLPIFRAREILFSGRKDYTAVEMYEMGLLTRVYKDEELDRKVDEIVANLCTKPAPALRMGKSVLNRSFEGINWDAALTIERNAIMWLFYSQEVQNLRSIAEKAMAAQQQNK